MEPIREDIDNFLDLHEAASGQAVAAAAAAAGNEPGDIQLPDDFDYSLLQDLQEEFPDQAAGLIPENFDNIRPIDVTDDSAEAFQGQATFDDLNPDYYQFYMPHYYRPEKPCQYCASRRLECKMFRTGDNKGCNTCTYLFRTCSFVEQQDDLGPGRIDLLHPVNEDVAQDSGQPTRIESLYTAGASATEIAHNYERGRKRQEKTGRFNREVLHVLRSWLQTHADHPYPTEEEKSELGSQTGLTKVQLSNWLANARRRGKAVPKRCQSPSTTTVARASAAIPIAPRSTQNSNSADQSHMTPFDRWKESPPEHEAPLTLIRKNAAETSIQTFTSSSSLSLSHEHDLVSSRDSTLSTRQNRPGSSVTSLENPVSSDSRSQGSGSLVSHASSRSHSSYNSFARKERRRRHRMSAKQATTAKKPSRKSDAHRPFQCTFCVDTFYTKHDWTRHEKSMHLNLEKWVCAPHGELEHDPTGAPHCAYCGLVEPSREHLDAHDHAACVARGANSRTFLRKDHLKQHLRLVHGAGMPAHADKWRATPPIVRSRCGFCDAQFTTWEERAAHLAGHFRGGATMATWRGTWGFEPEVAACVADAMPPFLIDGERAKPLPWSAEEGTTHTYDGLLSAAAADDASTSGVAVAAAGDPRGWEVVTALLAAYVRECGSRGERVTDEMLQRRARIACYASDDAWNQTRADDAQWLALFKQQVGLREDGSSAATTGQAAADSVTSPATSNFSSAVSLGADLGFKGPVMQAGQSLSSPNTAGTSPSIGFGGAVPAPADMWDPAKYLEAQDPAVFDDMDLMWQMDDA